MFKNKFKKEAASCCISAANVGSCCGTDANETCCTEHWIKGVVNTKSGQIKQIATEWNIKDHIGQILSRIGAYRMSYDIAPGLYAVGNPDRNSDVLVSANYKLSFDILRRELDRLNVWVLVLDTKGINVWCAAGKGTFGTDELVRRMFITDIENIVDHRRIIIPQLGAVGVSAKLVKERTDFRVLFGPVRAADIKAYIAANYKATDEMRRMKFDFIDRLVLTPIELNPVIKKYPLFAIIVMVIFGLQPHGIIFKDALLSSIDFLAAGAAAIMSGAFLTPLLLPLLPFRSFAVKGWFMGLTVFIALAATTSLFHYGSIVLSIATIILFPLISSYLALQFTGATTFTGMTGVKKELRIAMPVYITGVIISSILIIVYKIQEWGIL